MGRYNLLEESWIPVMIDQKGASKKVSLLEVFINSHEYISLACDTKTQEFAVLRVLLAVLHTVFSRFDSEGNVHKGIELDEKFRQVKEITNSSYDGYLRETWETLWDEGEFPEIVNSYLEKWRDSFYLFDEELPFFQVLEENISGDNINKQNPSSLLGKNLNRLISESNNKIALFSPKYDKSNNKERLEADEVARWLITFHGYTGLSDKVVFGSEKYKASKGWLFDIGGIYLSGESLFETLMLNTILVDEVGYYKNIQRPSWEYTSFEILDKKLNGFEPDNIAELYTNWSRAVYINPEIDLDKAFSMDIVKLPDINHVENKLEPMTIWRLNLSGDNKGKFTPQKHPVDQSMWRSFANIVLPNFASNEGDWRPGIISWYAGISSDLPNLRVTINTVSMQDDGNATSWVPVNEIYDSLNINDILITDDEEDGWVLRVTDAIELTKDVVSKNFRMFMMDIKDIRNLGSTDIVNNNVEELYFLMDHDFRDWLTSIKPKDSKDDKIREWKDSLHSIVDQKAKEILSEAGNRDFKGIVKDEKIKNIATVYSKFKYFLDKKLKEAKKKMTKKASRSNLVMSTTKKIINLFSTTLDNSSTKANLANLRNSLSRSLDQSLSSLQLVFENLPEDLIGSGKSLSKEELAIFTSLQLYASFQQGKTESVDFDGIEGRWDNLGDSLSVLRQGDSSLSVDKRFNAMITSQSFEELRVHIRHLIKLLKSRSIETKINFAKLAYDLYSYLIGYEDSLRISWSRAYYSGKEINNKGVENE